MNFVDFATQKAKECGWKISTVNSENMVSLDFQTDYGGQTVYIRVCGTTPDDNTVVEFSSAGIQVPDDEDLANAIAFTLLERSGDMLIGHWGVEELRGKKFFTIFQTQIAETLDAAEFRSAVGAILNERSRVRAMLQETES